MRRWLIGLVAAVLTSSMGVGINLATDLRTNGWAWAAVGVLTLAFGVITVLALSPDAQQGNTHNMITGNIMSGTARDVVQVGQVVVTRQAERDDVQVLHEVTEANLRALSDHGRLPNNSDRSVVERSEMVELTGIDGNFVITGEPGCGKSGVLFHLTEHLRRQGEDVVLLTVETLGETAGTIRGDVTLGRPFAEVLADWRSDSRGTLLIDGVDASRRESLTWLANVVTDLEGSRWRTVATMRRFDLRHAENWRKAFAGSPISETIECRAGDLTNVRHFLLGDLSAVELERLTIANPHLSRLVEGADTHLLHLLRNPFNLRLACELLDSGEPAPTLAAARDQLGLLHCYWRRRVSDQSDGEARARVLTEVSRAMLFQRRLRASTSVVSHALLDARQAVLRDGVLREVPGRLLAGGSGALVFSHHILFDYAVAALLLTEDDRSRLTGVLDEDPNLVLVARPSVDLHLADLWHADRTRREFAEVVSSLAKTGHGLAGIAAASVLVAEAHEDNDLQWLIGQSDDPKHTATLTAVLGWICGVMSAATEDLTARVRVAIGVWSTCALRLIAHLEHNFDGPLAGQAFRLLQQLHDVQPLQTGTVAADDRAECLSAMMTGALAAPGERGWLAVAVARFLPDAIAVRPVHAAVLRRSLDRALMALWPPTYLRHYLDKIATIAKADVQLAEEILLAVWQFHDDSEEPTVLLRGVVGMSSTRKQDVEHLKWIIGHKFPEYAAAVGLRRAVPMLAAATTPRDPYLPSTVPSYPIARGSAVGQVDLIAGSLRFSGSHEAPLTVLKAFVEAMRTAAMTPAEAYELVTELISSIRHPQAWRRILLGAADNPKVVGDACLSALLAGGLLAHPDTRAAAGTLIRAVIPHLSDGELDQLETAIVQAPRLLDTATEERVATIVDQLIACLDASRIRHPELSARMAQLSSEGGPPEMVDVDDDEIGELISEPTTLRDYLGAAYDELAEQEREILDALRQAIDAAESGPSQAAVDSLENTLQLAVEEATGLFHRTPLHRSRELITRAAEVLIAKRDPKPGSALGKLIISLLLDAATRLSTDDETGEW